MSVFNDYDKNYGPQEYSIRSELGSQSQVTTYYILLNYSHQ